MEICEQCGGVGFHSGHEMSSHTIDGECTNCPIQVPCDACLGSGTTGKNLFSPEMTMEEVADICKEQFKRIEEKS